MKRESLGAEGVNVVSKWKKEKKTEYVQEGENRQSELMKLYPWNWQHIYLLSGALMLIWEKLYSEVNRKKGTEKDITPKGLSGQETGKCHAQSQ